MPGWAGPLQLGRRGSGLLRGTLQALEELQGDRPPGLPLARPPLCFLEGSSGGEPSPSPSQG